MFPGLLVTGSLGGFVSIQGFGSSSYWNKPAGVTKALVLLVGGGGGNGDAGDGVTFYAGGQGNAAMKLVDVSAYQRVFVTIGGGGGGAADGAGANGGAGGTTSFGNLFTVNGGSGGGTNSPGHIGAATAADVNIGNKQDGLWSGWGAGAPAAPGANGTAGYALVWNYA